MRKSIILISCALYLCSCATRKSTTATQDNNIEAAIEVAITDFLKCRLSKKYNAFNVSTVSTHKYWEFCRYKVSDDIMLVSILPATRINHITLLDTLGSTTIPTRYLIKGEKLFYWRDSNYGLTEEMVNVLWKYSMADSIKVSDKTLLLMSQEYLADFFGENYDAPDGIVIRPDIDDSLLGYDYYFCKNNIKKYKRIITCIGAGGYKPPKVNCNCK